LGRKVGTRVLQDTGRGKVALGRTQRGGLASTLQVAGPQCAWCGNEAISWQRGRKVTSLGSI
jgi:hypothetical protein